MPSKRNREPTAEPPAPPPPKKEKVCQGCVENQPNQLAHMYGGCLDIDQPD
jgi:hypothetical protein